MEDSVYLEYRKTLREKGNEKRKEKRNSKQKQRYEFLASMGREERYHYLEEEMKQKMFMKQQLENAVENGQRIAIDLNFQHIMNQKEMTSLVKQIVACYGIIKRMKDPFSLTLTCCKNDIGNSLKKVEFEKWHVNRVDGTIEDCFQCDRLVYLSPDSPHVLEQLDRSCIYVIGGIVDKSRCKGTTLETANRLGIQTARLPIQEHISERLDHTLNVNTVVELLARFQECNDWNVSLKETIPKRKQNSSGRQSRIRRSKTTKTTTETAPSTATIPIPIPSTN